MADFPPPTLKEAAEQVATLLKERKETISVAETAAGGLVSAALLATPGASRIYKGGVTLYTLESRIAFAGWTQHNIDTYDGPTPELVAGLATHVRDTLKSTYCVGEVCVSGPTLILLPGFARLLVTVSPLVAAAARGEPHHPVLPFGPTIGKFLMSF